MEILVSIVVNVAAIKILLKGMHVQMSGFTPIQYRFRWLFSKGHVHTQLPFQGSLCRMEVAVKARTARDRQTVRCGVSVSVWLPNEVTALTEALSMSCKI